MSLRLLSLTLLATLTLASAAMAAPQSKFTEVNGMRTHYLIAGKGSPVVLLHGFGQSSRMWLPLIKELEKTHTVIAPDLRGAGQSQVTESGYTKASMAEDVHALVSRLGYKEPIAIVGHDIGLMVAYAYAAQYPDDVSKIVLMDAFLPGIGDWTPVWLTRDLWHFHFYGETPLKLVTGRERTYLEHFWNDFAADRTHSIPEADRVYYAKQYAQPGHVKAGMEWFRAFEQDAKDFEKLNDAGRLDIPMLVISGGKAGGQGLIDQAELVDSEVEGVIIPDSGHWLMEEAPAQVIPKLVAFLNQP